MNAKKLFKYTAVLILTLMMVSNALAFAQKKQQKSPGGYHGELDFPISWNRYYSYAEWTKIMHDIQKQYPQLTDIQSIGKSRMGRDQYLITITAKSTGKHTEKTAMWVDGAVHGNEVNGITCSLYIMWYLLTRYDYDPYVHDLVNNCTFYILPGLNVDANASFVEHPNTPNNPREPFRPEDNDGDGLYDEDRTEDVDGDGELSIMYKEDPKGDYKLSADRRRFIQVEDPVEDVQRFRRISDEGFDNDGDGMINEDDIGGPDPNRNYPSGWNLQAGNPYTMSEPETRNAYTFMLEHPNLFASFHYHNAGRLIMFSRPPTQEQRMTDEQSRRSEEMFNQYLDELRKANKYAQAFNIQVKPEYQEDMRAQTEIVTMGARIMKNYRPTPSGGMGQAQASSYDMLGNYAYLIELWGSPAFDADENDDGRVSDEELLKWIDVELTGEGWVTPHKVDHPDLGKIWIGGTRKKHISRTPPARYIEQEALKNALFVLYCASQFPKVQIKDVIVRPASENLYWVEVTVRNDRIYPTASDRAKLLKRVDKDKISLKTSDNVSMIDVPKGSATIDPADPGAEAEVITKEGTEFWLKGKQTLRFCTLVKMDGSQGWVEFHIKSQHGGIDTKKVNLKIGKE
jgi:hypothetical protein